MATGEVLTRINCPVCQARAVCAQCREMPYDIRLFHAIPILRLTETYARCSQCGKESRILKFRLHELAELSPDALDRYIQPPSPPSGMMLAILSLVTFWIPVVGLLISIWAWRVNYGTYGLSKLFSIATTIFAALFTVGIGVALTVLLLVGPPNG